MEALELFHVSADRGALEARKVLESVISYSLFPSRPYKSLRVPPSRVRRDSIAEASEEAGIRFLRASPAPSLAPPAPDGAAGHVLW